MLLVLKKNPFKKESIPIRILSQLIKWRLVSKYSHGGIVVGDKLLHCTSKGLIEVPWEYDDTVWDIVDLGNDKDEYVVHLFNQCKGTKYDWFSLLGFILPWRVTNRKAMYCFEWCVLAMGKDIICRVTPEVLLRIAIKYYNAKLI